MTDLHAAFIAGAQWWLQRSNVCLLHDPTSLAAESHYPGGQPLPEQPPQSLLGLWSPDDPRRAFVAGAEWAEFAAKGATMWRSDVDEAEAEAERRYPAPDQGFDSLYVPRAHPQPFPPYFMKTGGPKS